LFFISFFIYLLPFHSYETLHKTNSEVNKASSILYVKNITTGTTITGITIQYTNPWHNPTFFHINVNIPINGTEIINLGNISETIKVTLELSVPISCNLQVHEVDPYICPWLVCRLFLQTNSPSISFYMYKIRYLYLSEFNICYCQ